MKITAERWIAACVLACAFIGVMFLPPDVFRDTPRYTSMIQSRRHEAVMQDLASIRYSHARALWSSYEAKLVTDASKQAFGGHTAVAGEPIVSFSTDVPDVARRTITSHLTSERAARGDWHGNGAVGVLIKTDTATTFNGESTTWLWGYSYSVSSQVFPPTAENGEHCVTVIRLGHNAIKALVGRDTIASRAQLLDACAFYDAFGAPGPEIARWMQSELFDYGRLLDMSPPDSTSKPSPSWARDNYYYNDFPASKCSAGEDEWCFKSVNRRAVDDRYEDAFSFGQENYWRWSDRSVPKIPRSSYQSVNRTGLYVDHQPFLESMVRDLGPARFQRVWKSPKALPDAYFDVTGEMLAAWMRRRMISYAGYAYKIGPLPNPAAALISLVTVFSLLAISMRWARRPYAR